MGERREVHAMTSEYCQANGHNYAAWVKAENAQWHDGVLIGPRGRVECNICHDEKGVYELTQLQRYPIVRRLARLYVGSKLGTMHGREAKPLCHSMTLFALEAYGIDIPTTFDTGEVWGMPEVFYVRAGYDMLLTVTRLSLDDIPGDVPGSWNITAEQLVRLPEADPRLSKPVGSVFTE
jgi:hypothetical protein